MAVVTIEGSITPSTRLLRGERRQADRNDPEVEMLVRRGFAVVVDEETDEVEPPVLPEPIKAPAKSASRDDWAAFLTEHTNVEITDRTRDQLVGDYELWLETHDVPAADED